MFITTQNGMLNLLMLVAYRRDKDGDYTLFFPIGGATTKVTPDHPQFRQIDQYLRSVTLGADPAL